MLKLARPHQWSKNLLVFAAPGFAGVLSDGPTLRDAVLAFSSFCCLASATYCINDVLDRERDRGHPRKRFRPVAFGHVSVPLALTEAGALYLAAAALGFATGQPIFVLVLLGYVVIQVAYATWLRSKAVLDLVFVAAGFLIRTVAGAAATHVGISTFFLIVAGFGSIFLVTGKRFAEHTALGDRRSEHRRTLGIYSGGYLAQVRAMTGAVTMLAYAQWALERGEGSSIPWFALSIAPFVIAILRYELLIDEGKGGEPEEIFRSNRPIQLLGLTWALLVAAGVYVG